MTPQGVQKNLVRRMPTGVVSQDFDFTDVCPLPGTCRLRQFQSQNSQIARRSAQVEIPNTCSRFTTCRAADGGSQQRLVWTRMLWRS